MTRRYALWWWTLEKDAPSPWPKRYLRSGIVEGKRRYLMLAIIDETSLERAWGQVFRVFPDYRNHEATEVDADCTLDELADSARPNRRLRR